MTKYVAYYRVSTKKQGESGLGLEAQRAAVASFTNNCDNCIVAEFTEIETGTNKKSRPAFEQAKAAAMKAGAVLLIAKLDRLARNVNFISGLMESRVAFKACDMPEADNFTIHIFAALAEREAKMISDRTRAALEAKRAKVGEWRKSGLTDTARAAGTVAMKEKAANNQNNRRAAGYIQTLRNSGQTLQEIADTLNEQGFTTAKGKAFSRVQVSRLLAK
jgi:DNA invertase Pin-like site-specific DNA recombinase